MKASIKVVVALKLNAITMKSLLLITLLCGVTSLCSGEELDQNVTNGTVSRQKRAYNYGIESGMSPTVPTVSVDLWTLIRFVVKQQLQELGCRPYDSTVPPVCPPPAPPTSPNPPPISPNPTYPIYPPGRTYPPTFLDLTTLGNKRYFFPKRQKFNWIEAATFCRMYGMDLASIESREEDDLIQKELERNGLKGSFVWFSGNKIGRSAYHWLTGQPYTYENWNPGQPDTFASVDCGMTWGGRWHDDNCATQTFFICEEP